MTAAKLFKNGQSQAVRLPKEYRFSGDEVGMTKIGKVVILFPKDEQENLFFSSLGSFTDDFIETLEARNQTEPPLVPRESFDLEYDVV